MNSIQNKTEFENGTNTNISDSDYSSNAFQKEWLEVVYFVVWVFVAILNLLHILGLLKLKKNGSLLLILQICTIDVFLLFVATTEIRTLNNKTWNFSDEMCPIFQGTEVLTNTVLVYLIISLNFHAISSWNLHEMEAKRNNKNPLTSRTDSNECLVVKQENRQVNIDYRRKKEDVSTIFPTIFVWAVALSLSVPNFALSSTLKLKNEVICTVVDLYFGQVLQRSLLVFKVTLPVLLLFFSFFLLIVKLMRKSGDLDNVLYKKNYETRKVLMFGVLVTVLYFATSLQRHILSFLQILAPSFGETGINLLKMPPLYNVSLSINSTRYLSMLHYSGSLFRPIFYFILLPSSHEGIKSLFCRKKSK